MATLSDEAWADICAAAKPYAPDDEARALLSTILFDEYPAFHYDSKRTAADLKRAERMLKHLAAFAADHQIQFPDTSDITTERDRFYIERLRRGAQAVWSVASALSRAHKGKKSLQREWLYYRLCAVWLDHFHGELTYSRYPNDGSPDAGKPYGELIELIRTSMKQIIDKLPADETITDAIDREKQAHKHFWEEVIKRLHKEMQEDLDRRQ